MLWKLERAHLPGSKLINASRPYPGTVHPHAWPKPYFLRYHERHFRCNLFYLLDQRAASYSLPLAGSVPVFLTHAASVCVYAWRRCMCICLHWVLFIVALLPIPDYRVGPTTYDHSVDCYWSQSEAFSGLRTPTQAWSSLLAWPGPTHGFVRDFTESLVEVLPSTLGSVSSKSPTAQQMSLWAHSGHPSMYEPRSTLLNFGDLARTGLTVLMSSYYRCGRLRGS